MTNSCCVTTLCMEEILVYKVRWAHELQYNQAGNVLQSAWLQITQCSQSFSGSVSWHFSVVTKKLEYKYLKTLLKAPPFSNYKYV